MTRGDPDTAGIDLGNIINGTARSRRSTSNGGARVLRNTPARTQRLGQGEVKASAKKSLKQASKVGTGRVAKTKAGTKSKTGGKKKTGASSSSTTGIKRKAPPSKPAENKRRRGKGPSLAQPQDRNGVNETADEVENEEQNGDVTMGGTAVAPRKFAKAKKVFRSGKSNRVTRSQGPVTPTVAGATAPVATAPAATAPSVQAPPPAPVPAVTAAPIQATVAPPAQTQQDEEDGRDEEDDHNVQGGAYAEHEMQGGGPEQTAGAGTIVGDAEVAGPSNEDAQEEETTDSGNQAIGAGPEDDLAEETNGQAAITGQETSTQVDDAGGEVDAAPTHAPRNGNADTETSAEQNAGSTNASKAQATTQTSQTEQTSAEKQHLGGATSASAAPATSGVEPAAAFHPSVAGLAEAQKDTDTAANNAGGDVAGRDEAGGDEAGGDEAAGQIEPAAGKDAGEDTGSGFEKSNADKAEAPGEEPKDLTTVGKEQEVFEDNDSAVQGSDEVDQTLSLPGLSDRNIGHVTQTPVANAGADEWPSFPDASNSNIEEVAQTTQGNAVVEEDPPFTDPSESGVVNASQVPIAGTGDDNPAAPSKSPTAPANKQPLDQNGSEAHSAMANNGTSSAVPAAGVDGAVEKIDPRQKFFSDLSALHSKTKQQIDAASSVMGIADGNALDIDMFELRLMIETTSFNHSQDVSHWNQLAQMLCDGRMVAEGAGEKLRDFYRQWIHPLTFAKQEAAYAMALEDKHEITDPVGLDLSGEDMKLQPPRPYLFAQIIADFGGYDMIILSISKGDHECSFGAMDQLNLLWTNNDDKVELELAESTLLAVYHDRLRNLEKQFPEFGPVSNATEWSRLDRERETRELASLKQHCSEQLPLLEFLAPRHNTTVLALYDYSIHGVKISLYGLYEAYRKQVDSYGSFNHTTSPEVWSSLAHDLHLSHVNGAPLDYVYATFEKMLRPFLPDPHRHAFNTTLNLFDDRATFQQLFDRDVAGLVPIGPLSLGRNVVDPLRLYSAVEDRGFDRISNNLTQWDEIADYLGCANQTTAHSETAGHALRDAYLTILGGNRGHNPADEDDDKDDDLDDDFDDSEDEAMEKELDDLEDEFNDEDQANGDEEETDGDESDGDDSDGSDDFGNDNMTGIAITATGNTFASHFGHLAAGGRAAPVMTAAQATSSTADLEQDDDDLPDATDDEGDDAKVSHLSDFYGAAGNELDASQSRARPARSPPINDYVSDDLESDDGNNPQEVAGKPNAKNVDKPQQAVQSLPKATPQVIAKGSEVQRKAPQTSYNIDSDSDSDGNNGFRDDSDNDSDDDDGGRSHAAFTSRQFASAMGSGGTAGGLGSVGSAAGPSSKRKRDASGEVNRDQGANNTGTPSNGVKRMKTASPGGPSSPFAPLLEGTPAPSRVNANIASEGKSRAKPANKAPFIEDSSSDSEIDPGDAPRAHSSKSQQLSERQNGSHSRPLARQSPEQMAPAVEKEDLTEMRAGKIAPTAVDGTEPPAPAA
ncbi:uncharacterized protein MYCGRDRAFT_94754 [Zymoseptoria tritici IPO323]|uniref:ARID domain-containing protein n=1 Tax=Zymoseptoria tritici (strain CBS 115943 / IPO323) TaxID=336722 RepID=F9XEX2_ZYMTI|nr:uncharacterized protein MYCGRDRAFT_94754 [Zymoseptoria tritici IPO323]EGP85850.1 hypothetical protein MYCGRDRAFT_94754 [Zymoseptoria tritici IPO323]